MPASPTTTDFARRQRAMAELDRFAKMSVRHSIDQYDREGTLEDKAHALLEDDAIWDRPWVPQDFDLGRAHEHPVWTDRFSEEQRLAWNHLQWGLDYSIVGRGECQIIVINRHAVRAFDGVLPSMVQLEDRESFEEIDHLAAFSLVIELLRQRYLPGRRRPLYADSPSGFTNEPMNRVLRHTVGVAGRAMLGNHFPALFFLARGLKTHNFKPFENGIAGYDDAPASIRAISHLHRLDESRHMATALWIARLSNEVLDQAPVESRRLFKAAVRAAWPRGRMADSRIGYWATVLDQSPMFADIHPQERADLLAHVAANTRQGLTRLHARQERLTRQANKRIIEECGLPLHLKRAFVDALRSDPATAPIVDAVELPAA